MDYSTKMLGQLVHFEDDDRPGTITKETVDAIFIESPFFTGWMFKAEYFDLLGIPD